MLEGFGHLSDDAVLLWEGDRGRYSVLNSRSGVFNSELANIQSTLSREVA